MRCKTIAQPVGLREWAYGLLLLVGIFLSGCSSMSRMGDILNGDKPSSQAATAPSAQPAPPSATGKRIALLLPLSATGDQKSLAANMEKAARLALATGGQTDLIVKDTGGSADQARAAAEDAMNEGAGIILGPIAAAEVQAVANAAALRQVNVVSFASQSAAASPNSFVMGFSADQEVKAVVAYATGQGRGPISLFHPDSAYGTVAAAAFAQAVPVPGSVIAYPREPKAVAAPAAQMAKAVKSPANQALLLPEGGQMLRTVSLALGKNGVDPKKVKILGTSLWDDALTRGTPMAQDGWFAMVPPDGLEGFFKNFEAAHKYRPQRSASLAHDAVTLALQLQARGDFSATALTSPAGFSGVNGAYRFTSGGTVERQLAIMRMTPTGPQMLEPARPSF